MALPDPVTPPVRITVAAVDALKHCVGPLGEVADRRPGGRRLPAIDG